MKELLVRYSAAMSGLLTYTDCMWDSMMVELNEVYRDMDDMSIEEIKTFERTVIGYETILKGFKIMNND